METISWSKIHRC
jgi:hypothetical protein